MQVAATLLALLYAFCMGTVILNMLIGVMANALEKVRCDNAVSEQKQACPQQTVLLYRTGGLGHALWNDWTGLFAVQLVCVPAWCRQGSILG
jgi:hypothetical protein